MKNLKLLVSCMAVAFMGTACVTVNKTAYVHQGTEVQTYTIRPQSYDVNMQLNREVKTRTAKKYTTEDSKYINHHTDYVTTYENDQYIANLEVLPMHPDAGRHLNETNINLFLTRNKVSSQQEFINMIESKMRYCNTNDFSYFSMANSNVGINSNNFYQFFCIVRFK